MVKLSTEVLCPSGLDGGISLNDRIMVLGSCFADRIGSRLRDGGFNVCVNPFGTLYNPASILSSIRRLQSGEKFTAQDCVEMGAGAALICSFAHHTSFARKDEAEFLEVANCALEAAAQFWQGCNKLIITLGTAFVWEREGQVVSNCLKRPACEFTHRLLASDECDSLVEAIAEAASGKEIIFTVSPIRHLSLGAHSNSLSKARLLLSVERLENKGQAAYFPAFEILLDELRDYRFYDDDLVHPSSKASEIIWERFLASQVPENEWNTIKQNEKAARREAHRPLH